MADTTSAAPGHNSKKLDFEGAAKIMKSELAHHRDQGAKIRGDQSASWKKIEEKGLNKRAAKAVFGLQDQSPAEVSDYLRTFIGLLNPLGLAIMRDMVDVAEGQSSIAVPLIDPAMIKIDDKPGSVAEKAMRETAAEKAAAAAKAKAESSKPVAH